MVPSKSASGKEEHCHRIQDVWKLYRTTIICRTIDDFDLIKVIIINLGSRPSVTTTTETAVKIDKSNSMIDMLSIIFDEVMGINEKKIA